jgi:putative DNA primase/helicase
VEGTSTPAPACEQEGEASGGSTREARSEGQQPGGPIMTGTDEHKGGGEPQPMTDEDTMGELSKILDAEPTGGAALLGLLSDDAPAERETAERSETRNAERLIALHGADLRHVRTWDKWLTWDGRRWERNEAAALARMIDVSRVMFAEKQAAYRRAGQEHGAAAATGDPDAKRALRRACDALAWAEGSQNKSRLLASLFTATATSFGVSIDHTALDADPYLLNAPNGTIDLHTGILRPWRREDLCTRLTGAAYDPGAKCPLWDRFLSEAQPDSDVRAFLQRLTGHTLIGDARIKDHAFPIHYGNGGNGKGTFAESLLTALGEYAITISPDLIMLRDGEAHPTGQTDLCGARFVTTEETKEGQSLNVALVKRLSGGNRIRARRMCEDYWEFWPSHVLWLITNHAPKIAETKDAIWRRVYLIPWETKPAQPDDKLVAKLRAEAPGILAWAVRGALEYHLRGLDPPASVVAATAAYRAAEDMLGAWLSERCVIEPSGRITRAALLSDYRHWLSAQGEDSDTDALANKVFCQAIREHGVKDGKVKPGSNMAATHGWHGIRLKSAQERALDAQAAEHEAEQPIDPADEAHGNEPGA